MDPTSFSLWNLVTVPLLGRIQPRTYWKGILGMQWIYTRGQRWCYITVIDLALSSSGLIHRMEHRAISNAL